MICFYFPWEAVPGQPSPAEPGARRGPWDHPSPVAPPYPRVCLLCAFRGSGFVFAEPAGRKRHRQTRPQGLQGATIRGCPRRITGLTHLL